MHTEKHIYPTLELFLPQVLQSTLLAVELPQSYRQVVSHTHYSLVIYEQNRDHSIMSWNYLRLLQLLVQNMKLSITSPDYYVIAYSFGCHYWEFWVSLVLPHYFFVVHIYPQKCSLLSPKVGKRVSGCQTGYSLVACNIEGDSLLHIMHRHCHNLSCGCDKHKVDLQAIIYSLYCSKTTAKISNIALQK